MPEQIVLVGAGVVGSAIAEAHLASGLPVFLADIDAQTLTKAVDRLSSRQQVICGQAEPFFEAGYYVNLQPEEAIPATDECSQIDPQSGGILIESIVEQLDVKLAFLKYISEILGQDFIITSNTSTLRLQDLSMACRQPERFCGMHFFMPIKGRDLVEVVRTDHVSDSSLNRVCSLANRLGKHPLIVRDSPALVVNRMLTPYLNQGLSLLEMGADHAEIRQISRDFGMPRSPLEMIDMIGSRTAFNAGRVAWQAFPHRVEPSPIVPGLIKKGLSGWASGTGFYDYDLTCDPPSPSSVLNRTATDVIARYQRQVRHWTTQQILMALTVPMWIEASCILSERLTTCTDSIELAMREGLGFHHIDGFFGFFDMLGNSSMLEAITHLGTTMKAMTIPAGLRKSLASTASATQATKAFAEV